MRQKSLIRFTVICMALIMAFAPVNANAATILKRGSRGSQVKMVQTTLKELGYFTYPNATGYYGSLTETAVKRFQKDNGIPADGVVGNRTLGILYGDTESNSETDTVKLKSTAVKTTAIVKTKYSGSLDWFKQVKDIWKRGMDAVVTDVDTGKSFNVKRTYGTNHADVEPLTKEDTKTIKEIWGGFSWKRRAVVVQFGEYTIAASMTAMPHAGVDSAAAGKYVSNRSNGYGSGYNLDQVKNNGASGVMDIHFKNSRTHSTNTKQKSQQDMVKKAAEYIKNISLES